MGNRLLKTGDKIEFRDIISAEELDSGIKPRVYVSQIFEIYPSGNLNVAMPISKGQLVPLSRGKRFETFFYTSKGMYQCKCVIVDRHKTDNFYTLEVEIQTDLQKYQRRKYFRLEKTMPVYYVELTDEDYTTILETHHFPERLKNLNMFCEGTVLDISGGGMRFVGKVPAENGKIVLIMFDIVDGNKVKKIRLPASVILSFKPVGRAGIYEHRVEFQNISREYRELLIRYIFEEERKKRSLD